MTERKGRERAEQDATAATVNLEKADKERDAATAAALESKTVAQRAEQGRQDALKEKDAVASEAAKAKSEAAQRLAEAEKAAANLKIATDKAKAAEAEVAKLKTDSAAGLRATQLALADSLGRLGAAQMDSRAYNEAEATLRQSLDWRVKLQADPWSIVENRALLGSALMQRSQDAAALQEIQTAAAAFETLGAPANDADRARAAAISKRIVQFYTVTGRRRDATEWKRRFDAVLAPKPPVPQ
jgi:colicin import membrane protein